MASQGSHSTRGRSITSHKAISAAASAVLVVLLLLLLLLPLVVVVVVATLMAAAAEVLGGVWEAGVVTDLNEEGGQKNYGDFNSDLMMMSSK